MVSLKFLTEVYELLGEQGYAISFSPAKQKSINTDTRNSIYLYNFEIIVFQVICLYYFTAYSLLVVRHFRQ